MGVLHVEPGALQEFIARTQRALESANVALQEEDVPPDTDAAPSFRSKLEYVFRQIHSIKGHAALLQLEYFENRAHDIEDRIAELHRHPDFTGEDFLPILLAQSEIHGDLAAIENLVARLVAMHGSFPAAQAVPPLESAPEEIASEAQSVAEQPGNQVLESVSNLVDHLSFKLGKEAIFVTDHFAGADLPAKYRELFQDVIIQLTRNSLVHGIETPMERICASKERSGRIELFSVGGEERDENFEFVFRDDGRGLNPQTLMSKAIELGIATSRDMSNWDDSSLASLIFEPGFSTAAETTAEAGRGVGMDIIKNRVVDECDGEIRINSTPGKFCEFHIILPMKETVRHSQGNS